MRTERRVASELLRVTSGRHRAAPSAHAIGAAQLVGWGAAFYALSPLVPSISADLAVSPTVFAVAISIGLALSAVASLAVARWIHHHGARVPMTLGTVVAGAALVILAASSSAGAALLAVVVLGAVQAVLLYEPAFTAVSVQLADAIARTRAISIITFWGGWAALWALPVTSTLNRWIGWRPTLITLMLVLVVVTLPVHARLPAPVVRRRTAVTTGGPPISRGLAAAFGLGTFATAAVVVNGLLWVVEHGISFGAAAAAFALLAPLQVAGRIWFLRRDGKLVGLDGALPFALVGAGVLALVAAPHGYALVMFVVLFGAGAGLLTTIRAAVIVTRIPGEHLARHLGVYSVVTNFARALAPATSAWLYAVAGYELSLIVLAAIAIVAALLVWRATSCVPAGETRRIACYATSVRACA